MFALKNASGKEDPKFINVVISVKTHLPPVDLMSVLISIEEKLLENSQLMKEGEIVTVITNSENGIPLSVDMPANVVLEVVSTEPGVKGNTATNATKPATLETGAVVNVPLFINEGDKIKVDSIKGQYKERAKE